MVQDMIQADAVDFARVFAALRGINKIVTS